VTNIHQLAERADRWLPAFGDLIIVDEGHHNAAPSWLNVFRRFPDARDLQPPLPGCGKTVRRRGRLDRCEARDPVPRSRPGARVGGVGVRRAAYRRA
jgi:hypothetical protein